MIPLMSAPAPRDRRTSVRSDTTHLAAVRVNPDRDGPACSGKLQDVSAGGIGLVMSRAVRVGDTFLVQPYQGASGSSGAKLLYRVVRCEPRGGQFLIGGILLAAAGDIERDAAGRIAPAELERIRRAMMAA